MIPASDFSCERQPLISEAERIVTMAIVCRVVLVFIFQSRVFRPSLKIPDDGKLAEDRDRAEKPSEAPRSDCFDPGSGGPAVIGESRRPEALRPHLSVSLPFTVALNISSNVERASNRIAICSSHPAVRIHMSNHLCAFPCWNPLSARRRGTCDRVTHYLFNQQLSCQL